MVLARKFVYAKRFVGEPKLTDFELTEEELPALNSDEILCEAVYLSVDPYMRPYMSRFPVGSTMIGGQVAKVIESKNVDFPRDTYVFGQFGWRSHTVVNPLKSEVDNFYALPNYGNLSKSLALGTLGMPGNTAYFGLLELCEPQPGETVVVTGAGGAVGSLVGQIAKIKKCNVIGFAGTDEKCEWLVKDLGFDHAINYKKGDMAAQLKKAAPKGVDCYFDNVGGELSSVIMNQMNMFGRVSVCGTISSYNLDPNDQPKVPHIQPLLLWKQLKIEGFIVKRWTDRWFEGLKAMQKWVEDGKIKYQETITEGFDNMPQAFIEMLQGKNTGKAVVKVLTLV